MENIKFWEKTNVIVMPYGNAEEIHVAYNSVYSTGIQANIFMCKVTFDPVFQCQA